MHMIQERFAFRAAAHSDAHKIMIKLLGGILLQICTYSTAMNEPGFSYFNCFRSGARMIMLKLVLSLAFPLTLLTFHSLKTNSISYRKATRIPSEISEECASNKDFSRRVSQPSGNRESHVNDFRCCRLLFLRTIPTTQTLFFPAC